MKNFLRNLFDFSQSERIEQKLDLLISITEATQAKQVGFEKRLDAQAGLLADYQQLHIGLSKKVELLEKRLK